MPGRKSIPPSARIIDLLPDWMRELKAENRSPATLGQYRKMLTYFCRWLSPDGDEHHCTTRVGEVDTKMLQEYFGFCYGIWAESSVLASHIVLSAFFRFCVSYDELENSPMKAIKRPHPASKLTPVLTEAQIRAILATTEGKDFRSKRDYAIIRLFLATGMRLAELQQLYLADVELDRGVLHIRRGKGGGDRLVGAGPRVMRSLSQYIHLRTRHKDSHLPELWLGKRGPMAYGTVRDMVSTRAKAAGLDGVHPHLFRHWFAHGYLAGGGNESDLLQLAGWKDSRQLRERYGASLATERALDNAHKLGIGERW